MIWWDHSSRVSGCSVSILLLAIFCRLMKGGNANLKDWKKSITNHYICQQFEVLKYLWNFKHYPFPQACMFQMVTLQVRIHRPAEIFPKTVSWVPREGLMSTLWVLPLLCCLFLGTWRYCIASQNRCLPLSWGTRTLHMPNCSVFCSISHPVR